ncbi:putative aspartic proteinase yapsin-3 [Clavispora lusitaniae]|uniref:Aspartic proteinase yapsin-3 n=1 Tax=Clavispora lusitaniae TaxID=36911 RepID=A0ACD0WL46_CLALS|nr:putative aspartic proteinase yapsin-3 [Clavispora lusitaniae]QFZ33674.1 putative aspartic proteinase yapsin-3 [Clavispora lusitaniae]QFZ39345.1 putative aspartic proteinase yapsin-3 [Clavispora lusitaniae]QFZ45027.1 putative aspartic proteinase yapsin-3 [Clavispora lusitaniae]QFZ50704.1 putative aspartic proteinase yapsin-3 [Clavispora lusitaniae]
MFMRWAILLSIAAAAAQSALAPLNKTADVVNQTQGVSIGSQSVEAYFGLGSSVLLIPPVINGLDGENVTRPYFNDSGYYFISTTDHPIFGDDKVVVNGFELQNFTFENYNPYSEHSDEVYVGLSLSWADEEEISVLDSLQNSSYITSRSFSLFPKVNAPHNRSQVLFGAIDHGKYEAPLVKFKHLPDYAYSLNGNFYPTLLMDGIAGYNFSLSSQLPVQITENTWSFPPDYSAVFENYFESRYGFNITLDEVPCSIMNSTEYVSFYFSGVEYRVLESNLFHSYEFEGATICFFPGAGGSYYDDVQVPRAIFKHHYLVVDYDNEEIAIAPTATKSNPQTIEQIVTGIPSAIPAKYYNASIAEYDGKADPQSVHPTYSMYTGKHMGLSATESFYMTHTSSSLDSVTSATQTKSSNSTKSSSSKAGGNSQNTGSFLVFIAGALGTLMTF